MTTYDELVVAATVGVGQRPVTITALAGPAAAHGDVLDADPAAAVLGAAALLDAARRAAGISPVARALPPAACPDTPTPLTPAGTRIVQDVLADGDIALLVDLLAATAHAGYRLPAATLPAMLDLAVRDRSVRDTMVAVLGERGRWLAMQRPDWQRVVDVDVPTAGDDPAAWEIGRSAQRRAWLVARRRTDPDSARDLLATGWARESGDDRVALLATFATGLGRADEPFLEAALDDRKGEVRQVAGRLLRDLPGSAFAGRAEARIASTLRVERRRGIAVTLPEELDAAARRDGLDATPLPGYPGGARGSLLVRLVASLPIGRWEALLGHDPETLTALPVAAGFGVDVHLGWRLAAIRDRDARWAAALLAVSPRERPGHASWPGDGALVAVLPPADRAQRAVDALARRDRPADVRQLVLSCPRPWPASLADAVIAELARGSTDDRGFPDQQVLRAAGRSLPLEYATALNDLAELAAPAWVPALRRCMGTLDLRRRFHLELS